MPTPEQKTLWQQLSDSGFTLIRLKGKNPQTAEGSNWERFCTEKRAFNPDIFLDGENAGIPCGPGNGVIVLDKDDPDKFEAFLSEHGYMVPRTRTHETGTPGKAHYLFQYPLDGCEYGNRIMKKWGIDIKGLGGQVAAPGSIHPDTGRCYSIIDDHPISPAPKWLLDLSRREPGNGSRTRTRPFTEPIDDVGAFKWDGRIDSLPVKASTKDMILNDPGKGRRSENIMTVVNALVFANLGDLQIFDVFSEYPIGIKWREEHGGNDVWLQTHIDKARTYVKSTATNNRSKPEDDFRRVPTTDGGKNDRTKKPAPLPKTVQASDLQKMTFPDPVWIVPGIMPEGTTLLAGRPKTGKSFMALDIALALSWGGYALGKVKVEPRGVLYLSLEDQYRRLQSRIIGLKEFEGGSWPESLHIATSWPRADQGGSDQIRRYLDDHKEIRLIVVDVFQRFRASAKSNGNAYEQDYEAMTALNSVVESHGVSQILIHHTRKTPGEDPLDEISGSTGITGSVDTALILKKDKGRGLLYVTGRDVETNEFILDRTSVGGWSLVGNAQDVISSSEQKAVLDALTSLGGRARLKEVSSITGGKPNSTHRLLVKLMNSGKVRQDGYGMYVLTEKKCES